MKRFPIFILIAAALCAMAACNNDDDNWDTYKDWREANNKWLTEQENLDGGQRYIKVIPDYDRGQYVLMRWFNDRSLTAGNLQPYYTSTVRVCYIGRFYNDEAFDSSYRAEGAAINFPLTEVISGWGIALQQMHVGDSVEVIIPYGSAYGSSGYSTVLPYSNLRFNIRLVDIPGWETN